MGKVADVMRIYFDVSVTFRNGLNTGIQRVVRSLASEDLQNELSLVIGDSKNPHIFRTIEHTDFLKPRDTTASTPKRILAKALVLLRKARLILPIINSFQLTIAIKEWIQLKISPEYRLDKLIEKQDALEIQTSDVYVTFDAFWNSQRDVLRIFSAKQQHAKIAIFVHDILPITHPDLFERMNIRNFNNYFSQGIELADLLIFSSLHVLHSFEENFPNNTAQKRMIPLGSNSVSSISPTSERNKTADILMVGTLEPRKNYLEILEWFENTSIQNRLIIVGRSGWKSLKVRRKIHKLRRDGKKILWIQNVNDYELARLMDEAAIGICASIEEGFGLPLREFLANGMHVVASDIEVFREVVSSGVEYYRIGNHNSLESAILGALERCNDPFTLRKYTWADTYSAFFSSLQEIL